MMAVFMSSMLPKGKPASATSSGIANYLSELGWDFDASSKLVVVECSGRGRLPRSSTMSEKAKEQSKTQKVPRAFRTVLEDLLYSTGLNAAR